MPIQIRWYDETKQVVLWEIVGRWSLEEMHEIYSRGTDMCLEVPEHTINALIDLTESNAIPSNIFGALTNRTRTLAPNFDMAVIVSKSSMIKAFIDVMNKMPVLHDQFAIVTSREQGMAFIEKRRAIRESKSV
jgi:hypothetical protein